MAINFKDYHRDYYYDYGTRYSDEYLTGNSLDHQSSMFLKKFEATVTKGRQRAIYSFDPKSYQYNSESYERRQTAVDTVDINMTEESYFKLVTIQDQLCNLDRSNRILNAELRNSRSLQSQEEAARNAFPAVKLAWERYQLLLNTTIS